MCSSDLLYFCTPLNTGHNTDTRSPTVCVSPASIPFQSDSTDIFFFHQSGKHPFHDTQLFAAQSTDQAKDHCLFCILQVFLSDGLSHNIPLPVHTIHLNQGAYTGAYSSCSFSFFSASFLF